MIGVFECVSVSWFYGKLYMALITEIALSPKCILCVSLKLFMFLYKKRIVKMFFKINHNKKIKELIE